MFNYQHKWKNSKTYYHLVIHTIRSIVPNWRPTMQKRRNIVEITSMNKEIKKKEGKEEGLLAFPFF